jgi:hypothetical protein
MCAPSGHKLLAFDRLTGSYRLPPSFITGREYYGFDKKSTGFIKRILVDRFVDIFMRCQLFFVFNIPTDDIENFRFCSGNFGGEKIHIIE